MAYENNVCSWRTTTFHHYCHLPFWLWHVTLLSLVFLFHKHDILSCPLVKVFFNDFGTRPNSFQSYLQQRCAKWRLDVRGTILAFAHHTDWWCQYRFWPTGIKIFLWVLGCVLPRFLVTNELHIQNTFTSTPTTKSAFLTIPNCETTSGNPAWGFLLAWCATGYPARSSSKFSASWSRASSWVWVFHAVRRMQRKHVRNQQFVRAFRAPSPAAHTQYFTAGEEWQTKPPWAWALQSTGHGTVEWGVGDGHMSPFLSLDLMMWHMTSFFLFVRQVRAVVWTLLWSLVEFIWFMAHVAQGWSFVNSCVCA